jgi:hypothetical protein
MKIITKLVIGGLFSNYRLYLLDSLKRLKMKKIFKLFVSVVLFGFLVGCGSGGSGGNSGGGRLLTAILHARYPVLAMHLAM